MEFRDVIGRRRMVRNYRPDPIADDAIRRIVAAGLSGPSAGFSQGQSVVVVTDPESRTAIAAAAGEPDHVARGFDPWLSSAPAHLIVCTSQRRYLDRYDRSDKASSRSPASEWPVPYWWLDAGGAMMSILLAAVDEGLAAGFLGAHAIPGLGELLDLPTDQEPIGVITVGHPLPDRPSGSVRRGRRADAELVHWQRWGGRNPTGVTPQTGRGPDL